MSDRMELEQLHDQGGELATTGNPLGDLRRLSAVPVDLSVEMGRSRMTVGETLEYHGGYFGMARKDRKQRAAELLDAFSLVPKKDERTRTLSGGMKRRLILARALMHRPELLILDEPTAGVDVELRLELWHYVRRINAEGTSILLTTHYLEEAEQLCDRIAFIDEGTLVAEGKEVKIFDGEEYILERGIFADLSLVKAWKADETGNVVFRKTARNFNAPMATAGRICVAEVEEIVPVGSLDPDAVHLPSIYVKRMILGAPYDKKIEFRMTREREAA